MPSTYRTKLAFPRCLAVYIATSASRSTESTVAPGTAAAMPMPARARGRCPLPGWLGGVHRDVGVPQHRVDGRAGHGGGNADAGLHQEAVLADRAVERGQQ